MPLTDYRCVANNRSLKFGTWKQWNAASSARMRSSLKAVEMRTRSSFAWQALSLGLAVSGAAAAQTAAPSAVFTERPATWFEDFAKFGDVSPDQRWLIYGVPGTRRLVDLNTGRDAADRLTRDFESVQDAVFLPDGAIARRGSRGGHDGWFTGEGAALTPVRIPADAMPRWSSRGRVAFVRTAEWAVLRIGEAGATTTHDFAKRIVGFAWTVDGRTVLVLTRESDGGSTLHALDADSGSRRTVVSGLDTSAWHPGPAPLPDGRSAVVALAPTGRPDPEARHRPDSDRDQDLYSVDLTTGELRLVSASPGDDFAPVVAGGHLHWTRNDIEHAVVLVPTPGGNARSLVESGELPSWHPTGRRLSYMVGDWRLVDVPMNLDAVIVDIDERSATPLPVRPLIAGYHEDFPPVWSPDGRWMAYHSHRSATPVAFYNAPGATDDIYLRRADEPSAEEIRLTDFGSEVGSPSWSRDGRHLLFTSYDRDAPGVEIPWVITIDPASGRAKRIEKWPVPASIARVKGLKWSPTAEEIAIESDTTVPGTRELWIADAPGTKAERLTSFRSTTRGGFDWTPDGKTLVFSALADKRLQFFAIARHGGEPRQLTRDYHNLLHPRVSPDGRWIAGTRMRVTKSVMRMN